MVTDLYITYNHRINSNVRTSSNGYFLTSLYNSLIYHRNIYITILMDLGINYEGWTLQDTADYLTKNGMDGSAAQELYTTMVGDPAVYQSYSTGYYEMKELREYAEEKMGDDFDLKTFNTIILETGPCQFDILKEQVDKKLQGPII